MQYFGKGNVVFYMPLPVSSFFVMVPVLPEQRTSSEQILDVRPFRLFSGQDVLIHKYTGSIDWTLILKPEV